MNEALKDRLIIALDVHPERARELVESTRDLVSCYKVGPVLWLQWGKDCLAYFAGHGLRVMLDLKFHDIANTVRESLTTILRLPASECLWAVTLHASGGYAMLKEAVGARDSFSRRAPFYLLGVTVLTSLREKDLYRTGINRSVEAQVKKLAILAQDAGLDGVVSSVREAAVVRKACGKDFKIFTPGIQISGGDRSPDQKRPATPAQALKAGVDYLIVGRDIYLSENPRESVETILSSL